MLSERRLAQLVAAFFVTLVSLSPARAATPHETYFSSGCPNSDQVRAWSALPGKRGFLINAGDPSAEELKPLALLRGADRIQVEVERYPNEDALPVWKSLASQGIDFVALSKPGLPTEDEVRRLNEAGFGHCTFVVGYLPGIEEATRLGKLHCRVSLTFAVSAYPKFVDKPGLEAIPATIPLLFATDYWPSYIHMDTLNLLPHRKSLRVLTLLPSDDVLPYLRNIHSLDGIELDTEYDPQASDWHKFDGLPLRWSSRGHVPSPEALDAFARSGLGRDSRKLTVDSDLDWTAEERARIEASPLAVEWIRQAPGYSRLAR